MPMVNINLLQSIVDSGSDELSMIKQIVTLLKTQLKIDVIVADRKDINVFGINFDPNKYFYKIPLKMANIKYGMVYANGIDKIGQSQLAFFYSTIPVISILIRDIYVKNDANIKRQIKSARVMLASLTSSEIKAIKEVFANIDSNSNTIVISAIANKINITRSIIVNALKKIESAGIIDTRSLGIKGTRIDINNKYFKNELKEY